MLISDLGGILHFKMGLSVSELKVAQNSTTMTTTTTTTTTTTKTTTKTTTTTTTATTTTTVNDGVHLVLQVDRFVSMSLIVI